MTVWFTSDTHFTHKFVAGTRGFSDPAEHDEHVIQNINALVKADDILWILGDLGVGNEAAILAQAARLNGRRQFIAGNHDPVHPAHRNSRRHQRKWLEVFESVQAFAKVSVCGTDFLLSHFPYDGDHGDREDRYTQYRLRDEGMPLLHGHLHTRKALTDLVKKVVHVGWDSWDAPVKDTQIQEILEDADS